MNPITLTAVSSGRSAYRVVPNPDDPVILQIDGRLSHVLDISATGFSCPKGDVKQGRRYRFSLDLPTVSRQLTGYVDVLPGGEDDHLHCHFVDLDAEDLDTLHQYVLVRQKEAIRGLRSGTVLHR